MLASNWNDPEREPELQRLSDALADGAPIDWDAELEATPEHKRELANLQRLDSLRRAFSGGGSPPKVTAHWTPGDEPARWGHLVIQRLLGVGSFAEVYLAYDPQLEAHFALKLLRRDRIAAERDRFLWEARRLAHVHHPHVVTVHGYGEHDGRPGLWMDFLRGENLETRLAERSHIGWREAAMIGAEMCQALAAIHEAGLAHGDLKAANVVQDDDGKHVLTDFGAAARCDTSGLLQSGACGTPLTMAPELYLSQSPPTPAGDIYSLGVLLYRLTSGHYPVEATTEAELVAKHQRGESVRLRDRCPRLPTPFVQFVERALAPTPSARFASSGKMEEALLASLAHEPPWWRAALVRLGEMLTPRRRIAAVAVAAVVVTVLALDFFSSLDVRTALYRLEGDTATPVQAGTTLRPGDKLCMGFHASRDAYVYVVNEAQRKLGELNELFPLPYSDLVNPLRGGRTHLLPGRAGGSEIPWAFDATGGKERILLIASREPLVLSSATTTATSDATRGLIPAPPDTYSVIDRIVRELGKPNRKLQWQLIEVECTVP